MNTKPLSERIMPLNPLLAELDMMTALRNVHRMIDGSQPKDIPGAVMAFDHGLMPLASNLLANNADLLRQRNALLAALQGVLAATCALEEAKSTATDDALTCLEGRLETNIECARQAIASVKDGAL